MLATETNTFSPIPTGMNVWRDTMLRRTSEFDEPTISTKQKVYRPLFELMEQRDWELVPGLQAFAVPSGITPRHVYEELRDELLDDLRRAPNIDAVLLFLHGAMVADGYEDCEGDILTRVKALVGDEVPIGAELDLHCHVTEQMLSAADVLVGYKEYPHIDAYDRLLELFTILADTADGKVSPSIATADCRMIGMYHTTREPMRSIVDRMTAIENSGRALNVWLAHGFPYGDVADLGTKVVVVTDGDKKTARRIACELRDEFFALRDEVMTRPMSMDRCLDEAMAEPGSPVTIADTADNTGGGAPGDSTYFLARVMERGMNNVAIGPLYDPISVNICEDAGVGETIALRIGGKLSPDSGDPVDVTCQVVALADRVVQRLNGAPSNLGACAAVRIDGEIDVVLTTKRVQAGSPELFSALQIDPEQKKILVVKSTQHFHAEFAPISTLVLYASEPGALISDFTKIPYRHARKDNYWPFTAHPTFDS